MLSVIRQLLQRRFTLAASSLRVVGVALGVVYAGQNGVQQIQCALDDAQRAHGNAHLTLRVDVEEALVGHVALPVVQRHTAHGDPHKGAHHIHDGVAQFARLAREFELEWVERIERIQCCAYPLCLVVPKK